MKRYCFFLLILIPTLLSAQRGKDGNRTVTAMATVYNEYTSLTANATAGSNQISVASSSLNANGRFSGALSPGDLVMIIQMQGAQIQGGIWWWNWGYIDDYHNSGRYEFAEVYAVPNANTIVLTCPLQNNYTASGKVQVIRVPRCQSLTINAGAELSCDAWNGSTGGIAAAEVYGQTVISGSVNVSGKGFRGGLANENNSNTGVTQYASTNSYDGAEKGESIAGWGPEYDLNDGRYGRAAPANGGGGGNAHNGGGGGGANGGSIYDWNLAGNPDTSNPAWIAAWNLESANFHKTTSTGGGRGGYTYSWNNLDATVVAPGDAAWGGDFRRNQGGYGGRPLDYNTGRIFLGGGGGAGDQNNNNGGGGGNGGGMVYFVTYGDISGSGSIIANGANGLNAQGTAAPLAHAGIDAAGGGGGGGTVILNAAGIISGITVNANGGNGGNQIKTFAIGATPNGEAEGPGGGGGGGYVAISNGSISRTAMGGNNGVCTAQIILDFGVSEFPPNGATKGGAGNASAGISNFALNTTNDSICPGETAVLTATLSGSLPAGISVVWYDAETGGNMIAAGDSLVIGGITTTTSFYASTCPGTYRVPATVYVHNFSIDAGPDLYLCMGQSGQLQASGGTSYLWSPVAGLSDPSIDQPLVNISDTATYYVLIGDANGCSGIDSATVYVTSVMADAGADTSLCAGQAIALTASGGVSYLWNTGSSGASINVSPSSTQWYVVTATAGSCQDTDSVYVVVHPRPVVHLGNDTVFCDGGAVTLNAGNPGSSWLWNDNSTGQTLVAAVQGMYSVTVTNAWNCSAADSISVSIQAWADAEITPAVPVCSDAGDFIMMAAQPGGVWSGSGITAGGSFSPQTAGPGAYLISYTIGGMCGDSDTAMITIHPAVTVQLSFAGEHCIGAADGYVIAQIQQGTAPYNYSWNTGDTSLSLSGLQHGTFTLNVSDANGCHAIRNAQLSVATEECFTPHLYIPNIFSPNDDGKNDEFIVRGEGIKSLNVVIYNRWGNKVFESNAVTEGWDGRISGKEAEAGVYVYYVRAEMSNGEIISRQGNLSLVR